MENQPNVVTTKLKSGLKNTLTIKIASIIILAILLVIPISRIERLIHERKFNKANAIVEVSDKWGGVQTVSGPVLTIPYRINFDNADNKPTFSTHYAHFLPELLQINADVASKVKKRGIYEIALYQGEVNISGSFKKPDFTLLDIDTSQVRWDEAHLSIGINDLSGVKKKISIQWDGSSKDLKSGLPNKDVLTSGLYCPVELSESQAFKFDYQLKLNGSEQLNFVPMGEQTFVKVKSSWADPSFNGKFLPDHHEVSKDGFIANWEVLDINRNYPQQWIGSSQSIKESNFGVNFLLPVDEYQKNMRSAKYAVLVISLSFLIFFLIEVIAKKRFHPLQYGMVGLTIVVFYSLLLSFTEHIGFDLAYLTSSGLVIFLICFYTAAIFKSWKLTGLLTLLLVIIYAFIFIVLQLQDFSLLVGSLGIFAALAAFMYLSRDIDWYQVRHKNQIETA